MDGPSPQLAEAVSGGWLAQAVRQAPLWLALAGAGALGTLCRHGLSVMAGRWHRHEADGVLLVPLGTLAVNALGCFAFGLIWAWTAARAEASPELRLVVLTGFMGAFTTFSTFGFETMHLLRSGTPGWALTYVLAQCVTGVALAFGGYALASR